MASVKSCLEIPPSERTDVQINHCTVQEREILTNTERPATVVCKEHMEVLGLDRESLLDIFRAAGGLGSIEFLKSVPELSDFPLALLQTYHFSMAVHHYRRGSVIVKNSNDSEWVYIVKTGSCQVYKATKEARKERRQRSGSRPSSMTKRKDRVKSGLVFPRIKTDGLKSSSTVEINDADSKKKKVHPSIERAQTVMLPSVNPGKTSLINTVQENERLHSPNVRTNSQSNDMQTQADRNGHDSTRDDIGSTFFVRLGAISENGVFGMHSLVYDDMPNLSLVSQGAECVLISKQFLKDHITPSIANRLKAKLPPYPSSGQLRHALDDQLNWENYRDKVCWNRILKAFANSVDPDETPQNVASHQDPNCFEPVIHGVLPES
ncbi:hypothetical protein DPMN_093427 [Dreissena polymorpha]|uniref:Cyclic nucleotide-binding domain-containing protein n=1 Tax=Dreissena polymorpha TaxID=45954 RepID=A0A9D4R0W0_DREPO|nr:hypothetical protein DPMN_093427 [Dreissena polymorpha]